jgi:hypothetical protein
MDLDFLVHIKDELLVIAIGREGLSKSEEVFGAVVPF